MKKFFIPLLLVTLLAAVSAIIFILTKTDKNVTYLDFFIGTVDIVREDRSTEQAVIKKPLYLKDTVNTGKDSKAFIQYGADSIVELGENSSAMMEELPEILKSSEDKTVVKLTSGKISAYVRRLQKNGDFNIICKTVTIAVRGTMFSVETINETVVVAVKEGVVKIRSNNGLFNETDVSENEKVEISGSLLNKSILDETEVESFRDISAVRPIACISCTPEEYVEDYFMWLLKIKKPETAVDEKQSGSNRENNDGKDNRQGKLPETSSDKKTRLNVNLLAAGGIKSSEASEITLQIYKKLVSLKGEDNVVYRKTTGSKKSANRQLGGRINKVGNIKIISVSVTDGENGKVLFNQSVKVNDSDPVQPVLDSMAEKIVSTGEVW